MAPVFVIPQGGLEELERDPGEESRIFVQRLVDFGSADGEELAREVAFRLGDNEVTCIEEQDNFDQLYTLIKNFASLQPSSKRVLIETLSSNCAVVVAGISSLERHSEDGEDDPGTLREHVLSQRNALKMYVYFLQQIFIVEENGAETVQKTKTTKSKQPRRKQVPLSWNWEDFRFRIILLLGRVLEADLQQLYGMSRPENSLLTFFAKFGLSLLENPAVLKYKESKEAICRYLATLATKYGCHSQLVPSLVDLLHKCEHVPVPMAELAAASEKIYGDTTLVVGLLREIGLTDPADYSRVTSVADNVKLFLIELAERLPKVMAANFSILMPHLEGESYKIRSALVTVLGKLIAKAFGDLDSNMSEEIRLRNKQGMLDVLVERSLDANAFTRSCVLQTWGYLCEQHALSIGLWNQVVDIAASRLHDKAVHVRKSALQLLTTLLEYNPFGPRLKSGRFEATLVMYKAQLEKMMKDNDSSAQTDSDSTSRPAVAEEESSGSSTQSDDAQRQDSVPRDQLDTQPQDSCPLETDSRQQDAEPQGIGNLEQTRALVASLESALRFSKTIASTIPVISQLLSSTAIFDVQHGIHFLTNCYKFDIDGSEECLRKILPLVFSQERSIYEAVEGAFVQTYIKTSPQETAANLLKLVQDAPIGDLASLEALLVNLVKKNGISAGTISALWDVFTFNAVGVTAEQCRCALSVLCMISNASPMVLSSRIQKVVDIGFGRWAKEDVLLARFACIALQRVTVEDKQLLQPGNKIFSILGSLIVGPSLPDKAWYSAAEQAINAIYTIHPTPEAFISSLVMKLTDSMFGHENATVDPSRLRRYLFVTGHVALKHLVYIESCVRAVRKQRRDKERENTADEDVGAPQKEENINAELGMAASEDLKLDILLEKAEREIVSGTDTRKLLITRVAPFVSKLCRNTALLQQLRSAAVLCLCKLMIVDPNYCEENLQLLFTLAQNSSEESIRSNCIISLGDIAVRFPNTFEPWTEHIYARLRDKSEYVRKNAVLVIAHLILNDMMKVKGHISEIAVCTQDNNQRISALAKLFFTELSKKGTNPIYNLLPDILSRLSCSPDLAQDAFRSIMQFLIDFIKKDRQIEGLVEKLCNRFVGTSDEKQWQAFAYCLSQLTYTEKGMKKLMDSFKLFSNALVDEQVLDYFTTICSKVKKLTKQDYRHLIEEFEQKLQSHHDQMNEEKREAQKAHRVGHAKGTAHEKDEDDRSHTGVEDPALSDRDECQSRRKPSRKSKIPVQASSAQKTQRSSKTTRRPPASTRKKAQVFETVTEATESKSVSGLSEEENDQPRSLHFHGRDAEEATSVPADSHKRDRTPLQEM